MPISFLNSLIRGKGKSVFTLPDPLPSDRRAIEKAYARLFSTGDGKLILSHLQHITFMRAYASDASDSQLRYIEGQRALVSSVLRLIAAGRS